MLIWFCEIDLENNNEGLIHQLSTRQLTRYQGFCRPIRATQYLYSRLFYKRVLAALKANGQPNDFPIGQPHPPIETEYGRFYTSLTHSDRYFALCISHFPNAIDAEVMVQRDFLQLADWFTDKQAIKTIKESSDRARDFYRFWCRHECQIKLGDNNLNDYGFTEEVIETDSLPVMLCCLHRCEDKPTIRYIRDILKDPLELRP